MDADAVYHVANSGRQHPFEEDAVVDRCDPIVDARRRRCAADEKSVGVGRAHALRAGAHQRNRVAGAERGAVPLAAEVRFVPQFIGGYPPAVTGGQSAHESPEMA